MIKESTGIRSGKGFTLIELMIVVAIVGILAAIAIPAYRDYVKRAQLTEVLSAIDAIAQGAAEYYASVGSFPDKSYGSTNLAYFSNKYADITLENGSNSYTDMAIVAAFNANLDLTDGGGFGQLTMRVTYDSTTGYGKSWDLSSTATTIDAIYMPSGGH
jgi:type IV pilus assembly protein PilA